MYLDLLKKVLIDYLYADVQETPNLRGGAYVKEHRLTGRDFPRYAHTMIGMKRLDNIHFCMSEVIKDNIPGDFLEAGVWRGGSIIFMLGLLRVQGITDRTVWAADSFRGLPPPSNELDKKGYDGYPDLAVSLDRVRANIDKYGLLSNQVQFLPGWFKDTLPNAPIETLSVLRADGDLYESTMDILTNLYPKLSVGGYCIIDDYGSLKQCGEAVREYRHMHGINDGLEWIDWTGVYWKKLSHRE